MVSAVTNGRAGSWGARALPRRNRHCCCAILPTHKRYVMVPNTSNGGGQGQLSSRGLCPARRGPGSTLNYPACLPPLPLHLPGPSLHVGRMQLTKFETSGSLLLNARPSFCRILLLSYCGPACCAPACSRLPPAALLYLACSVCLFCEACVLRTPRCCYSARQAHRSARYVVAVLCVLQPACFVPTVRAHTPCFHPPCFISPVLCINQLTMPAATFHPSCNLASGTGCREQ